MFAFTRLALLCAAFASICYATNRDNAGDADAPDGIEPIRERMVNLKSTRINQKNILCPACIEAAGQLPPGTNITMTAEQFLNRVPSDAQLQFISSNLKKRSREAYDGGAIPDEHREPECTLIIKQILATSLTAEDFADIPLYSVPQVVSEFTQFILDDREIGCNGLSVLESA